MTRVLAALLVTTHCTILTYMSYYYLHSICATISSDERAMNWLIYQETITCYTARMCFIVNVSNMHYLFTENGIKICFISIVWMLQIWIMQKWHFMVLGKAAGGIWKQPNFHFSSATYIMDKVVKAIVWSGGIIGCGYVLMKTTVPTEQDMINVNWL